MTRTNISYNLKNYTAKMAEWNKILSEVNKEIEGLEAENKSFDWFDRYGDAKRRYEQINNLVPESSERNLMIKLAKFLYNETIARTDDCMMTFGLDEIDNVLNTSIDFDEFTTDYVLQLVQEIGKNNVLQTDFVDGVFDITVGTEIVSIYHLNQAKEDYRNKIVEYLEKKYDFSRSDNQLIEWEELDNVLSDLEVYSVSEEELESEENDSDINYWMGSDFTKALVAILNSSYAFTEIEKEGLVIDLSEYYA